MNETSHCIHCGKEIELRSLKQGRYWVPVFGAWWDAECYSRGVQMLAEDLRVHYPESWDKPLPKPVRTARPTPERR